MLMLTCEVGLTSRDNNTNNNNNNFFTQFAKYFRPWELSRPTKSNYNSNNNNYYYEFVSNSLIHVTVKPLIQSSIKLKWVKLN